MNSTFRIAKPVPALLTLSAGIALSLALAGCGTGAAAPTGGPPPAEVDVAPVVSRSVSEWDEFTGRISAVESVELRPRVSGYIERVAFAEGQDVRKGDLLFVIDARPYQAALAQAQASLERARSQAQLARSQNARARQLVEAQVISREDFESRQANSAGSDAAVRAAEAAVAAAQLDLQFTQVRAPISGRAGRAHVTTGNLAQADATVLTTVVSMDPMYVDFEADEQTFLRYGALARQGERAASNNPVRVALAGETGYPHLGTVDFIDNQVDPRTGTIRARAVLPNPDGVLTPGLFARIQLEGSGRHAALLIDDKAVLTDQDRKYVYVVDKDGKAQRRDVQLGRTAEGLRIVSNGLAAGDRVIIDGVQKIFMPGMPVDAKAISMVLTPPAAANKTAMN